MQFSGIVIKGDGIAGKLFGTPTANLAGVSLPTGLQPGVYLGKVTVEGATYDAAVYFNDPSKKIEVHLLHVTADFVGKTFHVKLREKVSEHVDWQSEEQMRAKIMDDMQKIRARCS